jgi:hypothetical protein
MNENAKAIMATVVIVACLGLLGVLAAQHVDGAAVAAIAVVTTLVAWLTRTPDRRDPPAGTGAVIFAALATIIVTACSGCTEAKAPREQARSVVLTIAEGVRTGDLACASLARAKGDVALAETCASVVKEARGALIVAEDSIDAWQAAEDEKLSCATKAATSALVRLLDTVRRAGGKPPPALDDALRLAPLLTGACHG